MYDSNTVSYTIDNKEYAYNVDKPSIYPSSMKTHVPSLMPYISRGIPRTSKTSINQNMFVNAGGCKVTPSSIVSTQNYVTITKWKNEHPSFPSKDDGTGKCVRYSKFLIDIMNGDIRNMHICNYI